MGSPTPAFWQSYPPPSSKTLIKNCPAGCPNPSTATGHPRRESRSSFFEKISAELPGPACGDDPAAPVQCSGGDRCAARGERRFDVLQFRRTDPSGDPENSILDSVSLKKYLRGTVAVYPLPLDVALPVFSWGVVFRGGSFFNIINSPDSSQLADNQRFEQVSPTRFLSKKGTILQGIYLHPGDLIRLERPSPELITMAMGELRRLGLPNSPSPRSVF